VSDARLGRTFGVSTLAVRPAAAAAEPATRATSRPERRQEIQALRAVAVLSVVLFHLWPHAVPGGFVGVDVFFAISGYLITGLLARELDRRGTVGLAAFWARRARRLLPAALLVVLVCAAATVAFVPLTAWGGFFAELRAGTAYVENWHLASAAGDYFAADDAASPVRHFWSLSAEEQFYVLWPLLMMLGVLATRRRGTPSRRAVTATLALATLLSLACSIVLTASDPDLAYYATPARAWEFGAGGVLALLPRNDGQRPRTDSLLAWLGLAGIAFAALSFTDRLAFPGWAALLPVGGALAVMRAELPSCRWAPSALLRARPLQALGDLSYSVYLWHWPLLILAPYALGRDAGTDLAPAILALTVALAWLTKVAVEDPVRSSRWLRRRPPALTLGLAAAATGGVVAVTLSGSAHVHARAAHDARLTRETLAHKPRCFGAASHDPRRPCRNPALRSMVVPTPVEAQGLPNAPCSMIERERRLRVCAFGVAGARARATVAVLGDSHASHWRPALDAVARARRWRGLSITRTGCAFSRAVPAVVAPARRHCAQWNGQVLEWFGRHPEVDTVIVAARAGGDVVAPRRRDQFAAKRDGYTAAWRALPPSVHTIVVLRDTPRLRARTADCVQNAIDDGRAAGPSCAVPRRIALQPDPQVAAASRLGHARTRVIDLTAHLCDARVCPPVIGGVLTVKDEDHFTPVFAATLAPFLRRAVDVALPPEGAA
jgi:peptidoglycan/LPS O-acetylase OafA/YrhL